MWLLSEWHVGVEGPQLTLRQPRIFETQSILPGNGTSGAPNVLFNVDDELMEEVGNEWR